MAETALKHSDTRAMTLAAFLDWDDGSDVRFELVRGEVRAMAPTTLAHAEILTNVLAELRARLPAPCRATTGGGVVVRDDSFYIPDLVVDCGPRRPDARHHKSPQVIVEVLSDSTGIRDRFAKLPDYRSLPSVEAIALIHTNRTHIELWRRRDDGGWLVDDLRAAEDELALDQLGVRVPLAAIYAGISDTTAEWRAGGSGQGSNDMRF